MTTCNPTNSAPASTCGGGLHRSRTPKLIEADGGTAPVIEDLEADPQVLASPAIPNIVVLDTAVGKNWMVELTGSYVTLHIKSHNKSGRRGTICLKNDKTAAGDGTHHSDPNAITNIKVSVPVGSNEPLFVGGESNFISGADGLSIGPQETVVLRYYLNGPTGSALFPVVELLTGR